jgi:Ran GTPase-activating protein (RanGAP) involved in mRNA processing and transport
MELAKHIHNNPNLEHLDLRGNRIGSEGARALVEALVGCKHGIKRLVLSCNCILHGDMIAELLSDESSQLESVDLSFNWIDDKAIQKVSQALSLKHSKLRELNLFGCQRISDVGVQHLLQCLKSSNTTLKDVNLHACGYRASRCVEELETLLALNRSGRYLLKCNLHSGAWPVVLARFRCNPEIVYHFLQENPSLIL